MRNTRNTHGSPGAPGLRAVQDAIVRALAERTRGGVRAGELDRDGRALRWVEAGRADGRPPVVLIAGCGDSSLAWAPVLPELAEHGRVVAYDRAGLGASEPRRGAGPDLDAQVADLAALVRRLDAGPAVLVGHSWGGQLAQLLAWQRPELVAGLVLVDPAHEEFQPPLIRAAETVLHRVWLLRSALAKPVTAGGAGGAGGVVTAGGARGANGSGAAATAIAGTALGAAAAAAEAAEAAVLAHRHQRRTVLDENRLTALAVPELRRRRAAARLPEVPVTVLSATKGLPAAMRGQWTAMQARIVAGHPRGHHVVVPGAGHAVHADRPAAVVAAVLEAVDHARSVRLR
ncbi:alpha/beta fold hydrolase [Kitasatospora sp. NPDC094028]